MMLPRIFRTFTVFTGIAVAITSEPRSPLLTCFALMPSHIWRLTMRGDKY
jgi:hypothetical protein